MPSKTYLTDSRDTRWGSMLSVFHMEGGEPTAEVMVFDKAGRDHKHSVYEIATCIGGVGAVVVAGRWIVDIVEGRSVVIPPDTLHHMVPDENGGFEFILWYSETEPELETHDD